MSSNESCESIFIRVSVVVMIFGWNLDDILLFFLILNSEKVDANVLGHENVGQI